MVSKVEAHFDEIVALVASGMTIQAALKSNSEFPGKHTFKSYAYDGRYPDRRARLNVAKIAGKSAQAGQYKPRAFAEEQYERSLEIVFTSDPSIRIQDLDYKDGPPYHALRYRAVRDAAFSKRLAVAMKDRKRGGRARTYSDAQVDQAINIIRTEGHARYRDSHAQRGLPHYCQILRRAEGDPALLRRYQNAVRAWVDTSGELHRTALLANDIYRTVEAGVSRQIDPTDRQDVISDLVEDIISGRLIIDQVASVASQFIRRHDRMFSRHRNRSLDEPAFGADGFLLLDKVGADIDNWGY